MYRNLFLSIILIFQFVNVSAQTGEVFRPLHENIQITGRVDKSDPNNVIFSFPGVSIKTKFEGTSIAIFLKEYGTGYETTTNYFNVIIDGGEPTVLKLSSDQSLYLLASGLTSGEHTLELIKRTESSVGNVGFKGFLIEKGKTLLTPEPLPTRKIEFIGNSITCGYGNESEKATDPYIAETENAYLSYASITARNLGAEYHLVSYSGRGIVRNWAQQPPFELPMPLLFERTIPLDSTTSWNHAAFIPEIICINLGTNDMSPGYEIEEDRFKTGFVNLIDRLNSLYPKAKIVLLGSPMLHNQDRQTVDTWLQSIVEEQAYNKLTFFGLSEQDGSLGFGADYHPSVKQHEKNAAELTEYLNKL